MWLEICGIQWNSASSHVWREFGWKRGTQRYYCFYCSEGSHRNLRKIKDVGGCAGTGRLWLWNVLGMLHIKIKVLYWELARESDTLGGC